MQARGDPNSSNAIERDEVVALTAALEQALKDKQGAEAERESYAAFISRLAHEMRNPLSGIFGITELLSSDPSAVTPDLVSKLHACSRMLASLLDDTLDLRRLEQRRLQLQPSPFHLGQLVEAVIDVHVPEAEAKEIRVECQGTKSLSHVRGDERRIRQILANLLTNAIKYTPVGGSIEVSVTAAEGGCYLLAVRDTGVGIAANDLETIFKPYFQVTRVAPGSKKGIGLGLSVVKNLVELMLGTMGVESAPGEGSTFWVSLPLPISEPVQPFPAELEKLNGRILVVDDNIINGEVLQLQLSRFGAKVLLARNGQEALAVAREHAVDIVLMDCHMPVMNGFETARELRRSPDVYGQPIIIALSASASQGSRERSLAAGMDHFLSKPVGVGELHATLASYLHPRSSNLV